MGKIFIGSVIFLVGFSLLNPLVVNSFLNRLDYKLEKQNDSQRYDRLKKVEDTARIMVASYESDKQIYLTMLENNKEIALQAKIRANNTAIQYNEYLLKNKYLWEKNIPLDIKNNLEIIK